MKRLTSSECGKAMVELAMIAPFLVLLLLSTNEIYKAYESHQFLSIITREVGNNAIRSCSTSNDNNVIKTCIEDVISKVINNATEPGSPIRDAKVIVGYYAHPNPNPKLPYVVHEPVPIPEFVSRYTPAVVQNLNSFIPQKGVVISTEVFLRQPSLMPYFSGEYYETSVF